MLDQNNILSYIEKGYLLLPNFISTKEIITLRQRAAKLVADFNPLDDPRCGWNANSAINHVSSNYFIESLNKASIFFESSTMDSEGYLLQDKMNSVVKIGHAMHDCDFVFCEFTHSSKMKNLLKSLNYKKPLIAQSRYFFKMPKLKGQVHPHQDSTVVYTKPLSCCALWIALEDAKIENGCMWIIPGSHQRGILARVIAAPELPFGRKLLKYGKIPTSEDPSFIPLEVKAGTAILMSGELIHQSKANKSNYSRQAYALHFFEGNESTHKYLEDNWLQRPGGFGEL